MFRFRWDMYIMTKADRRTVLKNTNVFVVACQNNLFGRPIEGTWIAKIMNRPIDSHHAVLDTCPDLISQISMTLQNL
jgi:hypothetical protein